MTRVRVSRRTALKAMAAGVGLAAMGPEPTAPENPVLEVPQTQVVLNELKVLSYFHEYEAQLQRHIALHLGVARPIYLGDLR
jgi:hypothetical protein